jgi:hypothetical protein
MVADGQPYATTWNMFFHFRLDNDSHTALINQCKKLIELSETTQKWRSSPYGLFIKTCTDYTLAELRRHWMLYVGMQNLPNSQLAHIHNAFDQQSREILKKLESTFMAARSLGPLGKHGSAVIGDSYRNFWKTGVTFVDEKNIAAATLLNPTFVYSLGGEGCSLHYGTDPLIPFHLAALFGNAKGTVSMTKVVKAAHQEFTDWCSSYRASLSSTSPPIVRFFVGEATVVCRMLRAFGTTGTLGLDIPIAQWKTQLIQLSGDEYTSAPGSAPANFNIIHTSNLEDHIGLLNVLITSVPLLFPQASSVLYTESLLFLGQNATKEFAEKLHADLSVIGLLVGLSPVDYLCGFNARCNTHELMLHSSLNKKEQTVLQFHQATTWKAPTSGDTIAALNTGNIPAPVFDGHQLGNLLYDVYQSFFQHENPLNFWAANQSNLPKAIAVSDILFYIRESFVLLLQLIRHRLQPPNNLWSSVMDCFILLLRDSSHFQELCGQLHRHGVYTPPFFHEKASKIGRFSHWNVVPDLVRIILVIPREKLSVLEDSSPSEIGTPPLQCNIFGPYGTPSLHKFSSVHVAFGRAIPVGTKSHPRVSFEEDTKGWAGNSSLVASFIVSAWLLSHLQQDYPGQLSISFGVGHGDTRRLFSVNFMDETFVHVVPETSFPSISSESSHSSVSLGRPKTGVFSQIGESGAALVTLDEQCELVKSLTARLSITDNDSAQLFSEAGGKVVPQIVQLSPCTIRVTLGGKIQDIVYPFPVIGSAHRLRLARKARYIEVRT